MDEIGMFLLPIWMAALVGYAVLCGVVGAEPGSPWWLRWPQPIWKAIAHDWRRPASVAQRPDYSKIAQLERELGIVEPEPQRPMPISTVCLTKNCVGDTGEIYTWSGHLIARLHNCVEP